MATPMMQQYDSIKSKHKDCILLFRLGDFYEMFGDDAIKGAKILDIALTARAKGENKIPMCGVPHHSIENYIAKLTKNGKKVALCDQVSDPSLPGIVKREVVRIITPGTTLNENLLDNKTNNFLVCLVTGKDKFGICYSDITTGDFAVTEVKTEDDLITEISKIKPAECIVNKEFLESETGKLLNDSFELVHFFPYETYKDSIETLFDHFKTKSLDGYGLTNHDAAINAAGMLLNYLKETQKTDLKHIQKIRIYSTHDHMPLDESTLRNLELLTTLKENQKEGSLISVLDHTNTAMGGRLLKYWITHPLLKLASIKQRLDAIEELVNNNSLLTDLQFLLKNVLDIERLIARLSLGSGNARDLINLKISLQKIPEFKNILKNVQSDLLKKLKNSLFDLSELVEQIELSIIDEPPLTIREGGMIKEGFSKELDEIRRISREGKNFIKDLQEKETKRTGISSLKVKFNKVFGYYIEISKANLQHVPDDYIRKQTLVNAERYITPELKEYEEKVLNAEEKMTALEYDLFLGVREKAVTQISDIQLNAQIIAQIDVLSNLAHIANLNRYTKPNVNNKDLIKIIKGRHPVVEYLNASNEFIPNDIEIDQNENRLLLITGPNMGGKSTILRQTALIVLMTHIGSFVPAESAEIGLVDRIFTRVGASDNLVKGQSTFMVEMQEAANILNNATSKSLIILDEIGRGTSTYDGVSIAWAITEYIHNSIRAKTLFATHYHELIAVVENLQHGQNYRVGVVEKNQQVFFLYKLEKGGIDKSYGIEVARLAGLPKDIVEKSKQILLNLEEEVVDKNIQQVVKDPRKNINESQMDLFGNEELIREYERKAQGLNKIKANLDNIDINNLTPLEALQTLDKIIQESNI